MVIGHAPATRLITVALKNRQEQLVSDYLKISRLSSMYLGLLDPASIAGPLYVLSLGAKHTVRWLVLAPF
jgi:hypothetical protein